MAFVKSVALSLALAGGVLASPVAAETVTYTGAGFAIPDLTNHTSTISVLDARPVTSVSFALVGLTHTYLGDLFGELTHNGSSSVYFDRATGSGDDLNGTYRFSDAARAAPITGSGTGLVPPGSYAPFTPLSVFNGSSALGDWNLTLNDEVFSDQGNLSSWSLAITYADATGAVPEPAAWGMMILGFGAIGMVLRRRRTPGATPATA